jgi:hypothetical protein
MNTSLNQELANAIARERLEQAEQARLAKAAGRPEPEPHYDCVTVRRAWPDDVLAIRRLEQLDGRELSPGPVLVAEAEGRILAARSLVSGSAVADPFRPTGELVALLAMRAKHLGSSARLRRTLFRRARSLVRLSNHAT